MTAPDPLPALALGAATGVPLGLISVKRGYIDAKAALLSILFSSLYFLLSPGVLVAAAIFFFTSSALTKMGSKHKQSLGVAEPPSGRKWTQVVGAGGAAAIAALIPLTGVSPWSKAVAAALASLAASNADTWAAEIGSLSREKPRLITNPRIRVAPGVSGAVTLAGELGAAAGSAAIALTAAVLARAGLLPPLPTSKIIAIWVAGYLGEVLDSVVGATLQAKYLCPRCNTLTDKKIHVCGTETSKISGVSFINNEATNLLATMTVLTAVLLL